MINLGFEKVVMNSEVKFILKCNTQIWVLDLILKWHRTKGH